jgi:hypothetical protein
MEEFILGVSRKEKGRRKEKGDQEERGRRRTHFWQASATKVNLATVGYKRKKHFLEW